MVPDIAPPRGRTYLVDTNGEQTRKTPIVGKAARSAEVPEIGALSG